MKLDNFRGELIDISAKKEPLVRCPVVLFQPNTSWVEPNIVYLYFTRKYLWDHKTLNRIYLSFHWRT